MSSKKSLEQRNNSTLKSRIKTAFNGLTLKKIALKLGIKDKTFYNYADERTKIPPDILAKIAKETGVSINWLLIGEGGKFTQDITQNFDLENAVKKYKTLENTVEAWYEFEGRKMPAGFSLSFDGWEKLTLEDQVETVRDIKYFADKMNEKIDKGEINYE